MKTRRGFVSNSSTTSFCIYGASVDTNYITFDFLKELKKRNPEVFERILKDAYCAKALKDIDNWTEEEGSEFLENNGPEIPGIISAGIGIDYYSGPESYYDGEYYIGRAWKYIGDDETGSQFKTSIEKAINDFFGEAIKCTTYEEAWRDG